MLLQAVILPPTEVRAAVSHVVASIDGVAAAAPPQQASSTLWRRVETRAGSTSTAVADRELDLIPTTVMHLPIARFGNVSAGDAARLADALRDAAANWAPATMRLAGGAALEFPDDRSVWARLDGDVQALEAVARGVVRTAASRGFFVDRRVFRPWLAVATITPATSVPHLERVLAALDAFRGEPWTVEWVSVTKPSFEGGLGEPLEVSRIPLEA